MNRESTGRKFRAAALCLALALVATACGTRLSDEERAAAKDRGGQTVRAAERGGSADGTEFGLDEAGDVDFGEDGEFDGTDGGGSASSGGATDDGGATGGGGGDGGDGGDGDDGSGTEPGRRAGNTAGRTSGEPIVLGTVGVFSGPSGAAWKPMAEMLQVWARDVNERGGIDGRPVRLVVVDDGGDPARHLTAVRNLVENEDAFAFVGSATSNSDSRALQNYHAEKGVPVVGGSITGPKWDEHPMFFPQGTSFAFSAPSSVAGLVSARPDIKRWGQLTCREAPACSLAAQTWASTAEEYGLEVVYKAEVSIAQPDFTAECLGAQRADAEALAVAVDPNSMRRLAQSCARQGYQPTYVLPSAVVSSGQNGDANLEGAVGVVPNAPWMSKEAPGLASMHQAVQRYAPNLRLNMTSTMGWAAGKMFERAVELAGGLGDPPSRERLVQGLNQLTDETLGGLSPPLTFREGQTRKVPCFFTLNFKDGEWRPGNKGRHACM